MYDERISKVRSVLSAENYELIKLIKKAEKELNKMKERQMQIEEALDSLPLQSWEQSCHVEVKEELPNLPIGYVANIEKADVIIDKTGTFILLSTLAEQSFEIKKGMILTDEMFELFGFEKETE